MRSLREYLELGAGQIGISLGEIEIDKLSLFAGELLKWNRKINLTAITGDKDIAVKHFLDSLVVTRYLDISGELLDLGSGGGFPAIPIKIILPATGVYSVDAVEKKILFQRNVARLLQFEQFTALHARGESLVVAYKERFPFIISRAFSDIAKFANMALPLLAPEGQIIAMKGRDGRREAEGAKEELASLDLAVSDIHEFQLPLCEESRSLIIMRRKN